MKAKLFLGNKFCLVKMESDMSTKLFKGLVHFLKSKLGDGVLALISEYSF